VTSQRGILWMPFAMEFDKGLQVRTGLLVHAERGEQLERWRVAARKPIALKGLALADAGSGEGVPGGVVGFRKRGEYHAADDSVGLLDLRFGQFDAEQFLSALRVAAKKLHERGKLQQLRFARKFQSMLGKQCRQFVGHLGSAIVHGKRF